MKTIGKLVSASRDLTGRNINITFSVGQEVINELDQLQDITLDIKAEKHREKRSLDANGLLWACLRDIAQVTKRDVWTEYLEALKKYGQFTYVCVKEKAVEAVKAQWRESQVVGEIDINGQKAVQMLCYFGSSTYNSKEFSHLLDGVIEDMKDLGLTPPPSKELRLAIERLERNEKKDT